jgi:signal transduction histidine kinase/ActR/RegA family two-component response regulator
MYTPPPTATRPHLDDSPDAVDGSSVASKETSLLLVPIVRERARVLAPTLLTGLVLYMVTARWFRIDQSTEAIVVDLAVIGVLGVLSVLLVQRRVRGQWNHVASMVVWWGPIVVTLMSLHSTHNISHAFLLGAEIASAGILLHTVCAISSLVGVSALAVPLVIRDGGPNVEMFIFAIVVSNLFALLIHVLMRSAIVRAEQHRVAEVETGIKLALQLHELERAQDERTVLQEQLLHSQRMDAVGTLAAGIAHDMNNILASITSLSSLALEDIDRDGIADKRQRRSDLEHVLAQSARGKSLTQSLLAFSRRGQYRKQVVRVADVIRDVLPLLARTLPKSIEIKDRISVGDARVDGDPVHLQQAIINLGINAADAMTGTGTLVISATLVDVDSTAPSSHGLAAGHYVRVCVTDTGTGMDAKTRSRVFEPFFTTKAVGEGTGLGLSTVWGIAQAHGGAVEVESELGRGSTFSLQLPITEATPTPPPKQSRSRAIVHHGTVLVVDDEAGVRRGTTRILERMGFDVIAVGDGAEAVRVFTERVGSIDLVVLDMGMPVMGGSECFRRLRDQSDVPILIATGYTIDAEAQALVSAGAGILEKPFLPADLTREVTRMLQPRSGPIRISGIVHESTNASAVLQA